MRNRAIVSALLILLLTIGLMLVRGIVPSVYAYPYSTMNSNVVNAVNWLRSEQEADGSIGSFAISSWAVMAITSAQEDPNTWNTTDTTSSVVQYLEGNVGLLSSCSDYSRFILSMVAAGIDPENIGGVNMTAKLESFYNGGQFGDPSLIDDDYWAVMALISAGVSSSDPMIQNALSFIKANQNSTDHGWSYAVGHASDVNDTAAALMALISAGVSTSSAYVTGGLAYMKSQQTSTGGFTSLPSGTDAENDSWAIQAIVAAGQDPTSSSWAQNGNTPIDDLLTFQDVSGAFKDYTGTPSVLTTSFAIPALLGKPYPIISGWRGSIRIEGQSSTVWEGDVFVSWSNITDNQGAYHYYGQPTVLGALDEASRKAGFTYVVTYEYGPAYVTTINGQAASGANGWLFRVNDQLTGDYSADEYVLNSPLVSPPPPPHTSVLWYWGEYGEEVAGISVSSTSVYSYQPFTVAVTYLDDTTGTWLPLGAATVYAVSNYQSLTYQTGTNGQVSISLQHFAPTASNTTYTLYAEKTGFVRTDKIQVSVIVFTSVTVTAPANNTAVPGTYVPINVKVVTNPTSLEKDAQVSVYVNSVTPVCPVTNASASGLYSCGYQAEAAGTYEVNVTATMALSSLSSANYYFTVGPIVQAIPLVQGWNLISTPIIPASTSIGTVLASQVAGGDFMAIWSYQGGKWIDAVLIGGKLSGTLATFQDGYGYWIYMTKPDNLFIVGSDFMAPPSTPPSYPLSVGWNLVGFTPEPTIGSEPTSSYLSSLNGDYNRAYLYDNASGTWIENPTDLAPGQAIWIYLTASATLTS